jgi:hypothetical protein
VGFRFQQALKNYGVADVDVFQTVDLWEKKDIAQVTTTLFALGRTVRLVVELNYDSNLPTERHNMSLWSETSSYFHITESGK